MWGISLPDGWKQGQHKPGQPTMRSASPGPGFLVARYGVHGVLGGG